MLCIFLGEIATWWRHQMETFSALLVLCAGNSPVTGEFPAQRPVMRSIDVFFDLSLNKRLSKQPRRRWFETPPTPTPPPPPTPHPPPTPTHPPPPPPTPTPPLWRFKTLRSRQNGRRFPDDIFKCFFLNENLWISLQISPKFVLNVRINNIPALVRIMAWRRLGDKPLSEPMIGNSLTHLCVTRPQWLKTFEPGRTNILYIFFLFSWNMEKNIFRFRFHSNFIWSSGEQSRIKSSVPFTWCRKDDKPIPEPNLIYCSTHIVTSLEPQSCVNEILTQITFGCFKMNYPLVSGVKWPFIDTFELQAGDLVVVTRLCPRIQ